MPLSKACHIVCALHSPIHSHIHTLIWWRKPPGVQSLTQGLFDSNSKGSREQTGILSGTLKGSSSTSHWAKGSSCTTHWATVIPNSHQPLAPAINGCWSPGIIGRWLLATGLWLPVTGPWLLATGHGHMYHKAAMAVLSHPPSLLSIQVQLSN